MNMLQKIILFLVFLSLIFSSCEDDNTSGAKIVAPNLTLKEIKQVKFPLDSATGFYNNIYYDRSGKDGRLYLFNEDIATVYVFSYDEREVVKKIKLESEGPNSVGENLYKAGVMAQNDTLFVLNYMTRQLFMLDLNGKVLKHFDLWARDEMNDPYVVASSDRMPIKIGRYIFFASENPFRHSDQTKISTLVRLDLSNGKTRMCANRPSIYNEGYFGNYYKLKNYIYFNKNRNTILCSFGASPCIYEIDTSCSILDTFCLQHDVVENIKPLDANPLVPIVIEELDEYEATTPAFSQLFYDEDRDVYYRLISHGLSKEAFKTNNRTKGPWKFTLAAYDGSFHKIAQTEFDENEYAPDMAFVNKYGLHIAKVDSYKQDENYLTFGVFDLVGIE